VFYREVNALLDWSEIGLRLGAATLAGGLIGLNRDLQGKPIGVRTLGLVGLATAMVVVLTESVGNADKVPDAIKEKPEQKSAPADAPPN
jgi:putative Mg2+ transporter-C (MgtC) family protein